MKELPKLPRKVALVPSKLSERARSKSSLVNDAWKASNPPDQPAGTAGPTLPKSEAAHKGATPSLAMLRDDGIAKEGTSDAAEVPRTPSESPNTPRSPLDRWSWTNSQAPSTPRIAAPNSTSNNMRSSIGSSRLRNVATWVRTQGRTSEEEQSNSGSTGRKKPLLKNQALRPVLAPPRSRKRLSKAGRHDRVGSLSSIFKPTQGYAIPSPLSPRLEAQRSATSIDGKQEQ